MNKKALLIVVLVLVAAALVVTPVLARNGQGARQGQGYGQGYGQGQGMGPCVGGFGYGQGMGAFWRNPEVVENLGLTDAQIEKLEDLALDHERNKIDLEAKAKKAHLNLREIMSDERPDANKAKKAVDAVMDAQREIMQADIAFQIAVRNVLTADQVNKLPKMERKKIKQRRHPRRQGQGPPS